MCVYDRLKVLENCNFLLNIILLVSLAIDKVKILFSIILKTLNIEKFVTFLLEI